MTAGEQQGTTICSRYFDVLFQGKAGSLIINAEKVIFRPSEAPSDASATKTSRSWRWAAIDRVEVMDPTRGSSSPYRQLKLKSNGNDKKAITLAIPGGILDDVVQDMNRRLAKDIVEGPVQKSAGHRRRSMSRTEARSASQRNLHKEKPAAPQRRVQRTRSRSLTDLDQRKTQQQEGANPARRQRRASRRPNRGDRDLSSSARGNRDRDLSSSARGNRDRDLSSSAHGRGLSNSNHGSSRATNRNSLSGLSRLGGAPHGPTGPASRQSSRSVSRSQRRRRSSLGVPPASDVRSVVSSAAVPSSPPSLLDSTSARRSPSERRRRSSTASRRSPSERRSPSTRSRRSPSTRSRKPRSKSPNTIAKPPSLLNSAKVTTSSSSSRRASAPTIVSTNNHTVTNTKPRRKSESPTIEKIKESAKTSQQKAQEETRVVPWDDDDQEDTQKKGLFTLAQQKLKPKYPLLKPPEKYRQIGEDDSNLSGSQHNKNNSNKPQRGFLNFMKAPPTRRSISSSVDEEIAHMEAKAKQQAARRRSLVESNQQRRASMKAKKDKLASPTSQANGSKGKVTKPNNADIQLAPMVLVTKVPPKNHNNSHHHNNNPAESPRIVSRRDIVVKPQQDDTSRTSASSTPESPTKQQPQEQKLPNPALWNPNSHEHKFRMMILHHAATCPIPQGGPCPYDPICCDFKRVLKHMESCNNPNCTEDKCKPTREFLVTMRLMTTGNDGDQQSHKDFLVGMGAMAPIPVIDVGEGQGSHVGDWDAFSMVSESSWWSKAGA